MKAQKVKKRWKHPVRNWILLGAAALVAGFVGYQLISGWIDTFPKLTYAYGTSVLPAQYPECKFAVISDLHYYDTALGAEGKAFQDYLDYDRKLLRESGDLLDAAADRILKSGAQFVLVSGDLTKDGERQNHEHVASVLSRLKAQGIKAYVVPGNHDINNAWAYSYSGDKTTPVPTVTAGEFAEIYRDYGYGDAIQRDSGSLSYVAEPVPGMWLVCMDACRYNENKPGEESIVAGKLSQAEETWLEGVLRQANEQRKSVMVLMHHGLVEHWKGEYSLHPDYLVEDYRHVSEMMASWNVRLAFTGHYHAQDAAEADFGGKGFLVDMETGSLVTSPSPVRFCSINGRQNLTYTTEDLVGELKPGTDFDQYAAEYLRQNVETQAYDTLKGYLVPDGDARTIAGSVAAAFVAHYAGDEDPAKELPLDESKLGLWSRIVLATQRYVLDGLWHDPSLPGDSNGSVNLMTGK